jgi:hypothetical protein
MKRIKTTWAVSTYDVRGNHKDDYEVNDVYGRGTIELSIPVTANNAGTPQEFKSAYPTTRQIRAAFGLTGSRCGIELDGDDIAIQVDRSSDGYPIGEMRCESHTSLSPIRGA